MPVTNVSADRNAVYSVSTPNSQKNDLNMQDYLMLVVAQMKNQDMNGQQDTGAFMTQMAQISSMQAMQELGTAFMSSMSVSYMGKYVKAEALTNTNEMVAREGYVERVNFNGGDTMVLVDNVWFKVQDIYELALSKPTPTPSTPSDTENGGDTGNAGDVGDVGDTGNVGDTENAGDTENTDNSDNSDNSGGEDNGGEGSP